MLGVGCRRHARAEPLLAAVRALLAEIQRPLAAVASITMKHEESAIRDLAQVLDVPLRFFGPEELLLQTPHLTHRSSRVFALTGCWGVAESAALASAGPGGRLVVPRRAYPEATLALAEDGPGDPMRPLP